MRIAASAIALLVTSLSILIGFQNVPADASLCHYGLCRFDQLFLNIDRTGASLSNMKALLNEDPANPSTWCTYAEFLSASGDVQAARRAFEHAVMLGPGMSPILMRAANFHVSHGDIDDALPLFRTILHQTGVFDQIIFGYLRQFGVAAPRIVGSVIPAESRAAKAWLLHVASTGSDEDLIVSWTWLRDNGLTENELIVELVRRLWDRARYHAAQQVWVDTLGPARGAYPNRERLFNRKFQSAPQASPFDWTLNAPASVKISQRAGLEIQFDGTDDVNFYHVHQFAVVEKGRYRFSAEVETDGLTTDQLPFFHILDANSPRKIDVRSKPVAATAARSWITFEFEVPSGVDAVEVEIQRVPSRAPNGRIVGRLHVYQVSLVPLL